MSEEVQHKIVIHRSDVPDEMSEKIVNVIVESCDNFQIEKDMSTAVKKKCDEQFGGTWHCVIGKNFGCSITHDTKYVMFLKVDLMSALVFKSLD